MKKIKISSVQLNELQKQQQIRDLSHKIISDLEYLSGICDRKYKKELLTCTKTLDHLEESAIGKILSMIEWSEENEK